MSVLGPEIAAAVLAGAGVALFFRGVATVWRRRALYERMRSVVSGDAPGSAARAEGVPERRATSELAAGLNRRLSRSALGAAVQVRLVRAGVALKSSQFITYQAMAAGVGALLGMLFLGPAGPLVQLLASIALAGAGFAAPLLVLRVLEQRRVAGFEKQLPQAIDSMAGTLQAGSTLPQAIEINAREMPPPISVEFRRVLREMELGLSLTDSLANVQDRVRSTDLELVQSAIAIQQRVGGDLAGMLHGISHTIRERLRIRGEINVLTAQGRYSTYIITVLPILLFIFLWVTNRDYISQLFLPGVTRLMLVGGIAGIVAGYYSMKKIVNIDI
jgi:tight adherence protein B